MRRRGTAALGIAVAAVLMAAAGAEAASIAGDFDGDGRDDLAIGVIGQEVGGDGFAGALHVIYGGQDGLSRRDRIFTQDSAGIRERAEPGDQFAASLAAGDFDRDGRDDLAVGSPFESVAGVQLGGIVQILYGSPRGLTPKGDQLFAHGRGGLGGEPELFDVFAWALAAGDFGKGRHDDLAVSTIGATVGGQSSAGVVEVLHGSRRGLAAKRHKRFTQASTGIPDDPEAQDRFGWTLVPGDFGKSRRDDLAIGVPFESVGTIDTAGAVQILYSGRKGLRPAGGQLLDQLELDGGVGGEDVEPEPDDRFGESIAAGDFGRGARDDIAIGAPNEDVEEPTPGTVNDGGMVMVGYGSRSGVRTGADAGVQIFYEIVVGSQYTPNMRFGRTLAAANFGRSDHADLAMSLPAADGTSAVMAGAVGLISGSQTGIAPVDAQRFSQDSVGIAEEGEQGDEFGRFLAAGRFDGSGPADLAIGVPVESVGSVTGAGAVHVLRGTKGQGIVAEGSTLLAQGFAGLAGAAQEDEFFGTALSGPTSGVPWD